MHMNPCGMTRTRTLALLVTVLFAGCNSPTEARAARDLAAARARWASSAAASYDIAVTHSCFCDPAYTRPMIVVVDGSKVSSALYADTGERVPQAIAQTVTTVDSLFANIEHALAAKDETVDASYDATFGFPVSVAFNVDSGVLDGGARYTMRNYHPR